MTQAESPKERETRHPPHASLLLVIVFLTVIGLLLVVVALQDVFLTLFHPAGSGAMSDWIARGVWVRFRAIAKHRPGLITFGGPAALVSIISAWAGLVVFGCSLVYWPFIDSFVLAPGMTASVHRHYIDAFNISLGSLISVGGDFNANSSWIRVLMGVEAVIGFGLLTASVSWLLSIYPVLEQRRTVAERATLLHNAEIETGVDPALLPAGEAQDVLDWLAENLCMLRNQMAQFPITYYFHIGEKISALPGVLPYLARMAERASRAERPPAVRLSGVALGGAIKNFLELIAEAYLRMPAHDSNAVMRAYADDQMREMIDFDRPRRAA
jgi:hypothetical protein